MIKIEEFWKINFRIGEVKSINKENVKVSCENRDFVVGLDFDVKEGDKLAVIIYKDKLIIPVVNEKIPLIPEKDIEVGSKIR